MSGINSILYTAKQALLSNLTALNVTGSNIANVNTAGYTRLSPIFESAGSTDPLSTEGQIGVKIADIQRVYDKFLQSQIIQQDSAVGSATSRNNSLSQIESVINESSGGGINDALSQFWGAWSDLSANPSGQAQRDVLISAAQNLTTVFNQRAEELSNLQNNTDQTIASDVTTLNGYLNDMSALNTKIADATAAGDQASSLKDNQTELLGKISSLIDVNYVEQPDGSLYIYLASNGKTLVQGNNNWQLAVQKNSANSSLNDIVFANDPNTPLNNNINGGELGGLLNIRDVILPSYINSLNQTASSIINKVNAQQMAGYDRNGNAGGVFFTPTTEAINMQVSNAIFADPSLIAASSTFNADGNNATAMAAIADDNMYASLGNINPPPSATSSVIGAGTGLNAADHIVLTRGATTGLWTVTTQTNYPAMVVTAATANSVTISADGTNNAITLNLSGTWEPGDTAAFDITAAGPTVSTVSVTDTGNNFATGVINNIGQTYKNTTSPITLTRGATSAPADWTINDNGGYTSLTVLSATDKTVTLDLNGNNTADITLNLSGTWANGDTIAFSLTKQDKTTNIDGYYNSFLAKMGQDVSMSSTTLDRENAIASQQNNQREQVSGVSLDEEMMNLIKYQMAYNAAGRLTKTISEIMDVLISLGQ